MPEINIDLKGILKRLSNLKPDKAPGPDGIKPIILKELKSGNSTSQSSTFPKIDFYIRFRQTGQKPMFARFSRREVKVIQPIIAGIIGPSP